MRPFYLEHPTILETEVDVLDMRPGAVLVERSPFFPGGGGQLADRGHVRLSGRTAPVTETVPADHGVWHTFEGEAEPQVRVVLAVDPAFRQLMSELHTLAHVVNALVYPRFGGALLTGAQLGADGTFRIDADLPGADNDALRALEGPLNDVIRADLPVGTSFMPYAEAQAVPGLFRSKAVAPAARRGWSRAHCRNWQPRPPGLRRHPPRLDRTSPAGAHRQDRQQGAAEPAHQGINLTLVQNSTVLHG